LGQYWAAAHERFELLERLVLVFAPVPVHRMFGQV
jgi:hypothetical protein